MINNSEGLLPLLWVTGTWNTSLSWCLSRERQVVLANCLREAGKELRWDSHPFLFAVSLDLWNDRMSHMESKKLWCTGQDQRGPLSSQSFSASYQFSSLWNCTIRCDSSGETNVPPAHFPMLWDLPKSLGVNLVLIIPHPSQLLSPPSLKGDWHWEEEWDGLPVICKSISAVPSPNCDQASSQKVVSA